MARCTFIPASALRGTRWDPGFWHAGGTELAAECGLLPARLGDFIEAITYGPILPGRPPVPVEHGVTIVGQREIRATGLTLDRATVVAEGSPHDPPRCRLRAGDLVLARSGVGTLAQRRLTVFRGKPKATVSCFVDLVRLRGINPCYVAAFLRTDLGWSQVRRLIRGVGTPNLSFGQIRSLQVPLLPPEEQDAIARRWRKIARLHDAGRLREAQSALDRLVVRLDARLRRGTGGL
ncbi:MAG: hypothetical protein FJ291_10935 [Planctomycetes bacterium]|nr:hypothetical protein [Planctomycetota bacterium]